MAYAIAVEKSTNAKIGVTHATYASQASCPTSCPLRNAGCYAEQGLVGIHTKRLNAAAIDATPLDVARDEADAIRTLSGTRDLRLHVVGDCTTDETASLVATAALETVKPGNRTWSYTHGWRDVDRASWGEVSVLASTETFEQATEALDRGWAPAIVVGEHEDDKMYRKEGLKVLPCVNQTRGISCADCRLCFDAERLHGKGMVIAFAAHGSRKSRVLSVLDEVRETEAVPA
jgi:hypothetical protein